MENEPVLVARCLSEAIEAGDIAALRAIYAEDAI